MSGDPLITPRGQPGSAEAPATGIAWAAARRMLAAARAAEAPSLLARFARERLPAGCPRVCFMGPGR